MTLDRDVHVILVYMILDPDVLPDGACMATYVKYFYLVEQIIAQGSVVHGQRIC